MWSKKPKSFLLRVGLVAAAFAAVFVAPSPGADAVSEPVIRVEEDWKLVLNEPDNAMDAPQFHTVMSPFGNVDSVYIQAMWNYWDLPEFASGGLQLQAWNGENCQYQVGYFDGKQLSTDSETILWTQALETNGYWIRFEIVKGTSLTWGDFGGPSMTLYGPVSITDLSQYSPVISVKNSWVTYGANRINTLVITKVRYYGASGLLYEETLPRVVFKQIVE